MYSVQMWVIGVDWYFEHPECFCAVGKYGLLCA
jgi:hypothetical protein